MSAPRTWWRRTGTRADRRSAQVAVAAISTGVSTWGMSGQVAARAANPAGDQFYLWSSTGLSAVNAVTAKTLWRVKNESGEVTADGRRVYVSSAGRINAYDAKSGKLLWTRTINAPGRPIRAGGLLYTVAGNKSLVVLWPTNGKPISYGTSHTGLTDHVVAAGGALYLTRGNNVRAYAP